ncbi:hypothetical protein ABZ379_48870 [Streptomyces canus]|uniref:hypothetical protein n=1 Tax=Streptomyces canus TaxID=58343 RepID=UPI0033DE3A3C
MSNTAQAPNVAAFLAELSALTVKHGLAVAGCGCCGSPFLVPTGEKYPNPCAQSLEFHQSAERYETET